MHFNLTVLSKPHLDKITYTQFPALLSEISCNYQAYYMWSNPPWEMQQFIENTNFSQTPNVIIGVKDLLDGWVEFNHWRDTSGICMQMFDEMASNWPDTNFVILTSVENFNKEHYKSPNLQFISWGGDWLNQFDEYKTLIPVLDKDFSSNRSFISLNRQPRNHRIVLLSYLFGKNLNEYGQISYLSNQDLNILKNPKTNFLDTINWEFDDTKHKSVREIIIQGFDDFFSNTARQELIIDSCNIYDKDIVCDNVTNFNRSLRSKYRCSFVEIVSESVFTTPGFFITEKTAHCFYGCNFPIILGGPGIVDHLRNIGFDMFDDIIDHSYDHMADPIDRIVSAIDNNLQIITNVNMAKQLWKENKERFIKNIKVINQIDAYYSQRTVDQWSHVKWV